MLMRLSATVFGINNLTARLPAMLGATVYIGSALWLCLKLTSRGLLQLLLLICLVYNPMVLDYLVAARGYSLAVAFLLAAIGVIASVMIADEIDSAILRKKAAWLSVLLALSCAANFSFAIANGTLLLIFFLWAARRMRFAGSESVQLAMWSFLPGLLAGFLLCGSVVLHWPKGELYFGSKNMAQMWSAFATGSFDELNPNLVNPLVMPWLARLGGIMPYIAVSAGVFLFFFSEINRRRRPDANAERLGNFVRILAVVSVITLALHWLAFKIFAIPLPKDRTGLFLVPLWTLVFAGCLAMPSADRVSGLVRWFGTAVLTLSAFYFLGCLRIGHFKEWRFDSDTKTLYWIVDDLHRRCGIERFAVDWRYQMALNFYRREYRNDSLKEFNYSTSGELPVDRDAYAIFYPTSEEFIEQQRLRVIYHNEESGAAVAIRSCVAE